MSKEIESKRQLSSSIMRLVGNDGPPFPLYVNRHSKSSSYSCQLYDGCSSRRSSAEHQEFKNVYEDFEASQFLCRHCSFDTNDTFLEFREKRNSLYGKCMNDQHFVSSSSLGRHHLHKHGMIFHPNHKDGRLLEPHNLYRAHISRKTSKIHVEKKNEKINIRRRIVVLKPHRVKMPNSVTNNNFKAFPILGSSSLRGGFSKSAYKEAREVAKKVIRSVTDYLDDIVDSGDGKLPKCSSFNPAESSVNRVTKTRLYELWKMTKKYQYFEMLHEGSARSELLALSDKETRSNQLNSKTSLNRTSKRHGSNNINGVWKGETNRTLSRSGSLPPSIGGSSHKRSTYYNKYGEDKYVVRSDPKSCSKAVKGNPSRNLSFGGKEFWSRKPIPHRHKITHKMDPVSEANFEMQMEANIKNGFNLYSFRDDDKSTAHGDEDFGQKLRTGDSFKDAGGPSPVSVLVEVPPTKDTPSSSESSDGVGAELHALRTHAQIPINEQVAQLSPNYSLETQSWETYYALDILTDSGLQESDFHMFQTKWHSPDSPLNSKIFDNLEITYETTSSISERLLLFDRMNFAIFEIFKEHVNLFPWVRTKFAVPSSTKHDEWIRVVFDKLINQDEQRGAELSERVLDKVSQWSDFREEIDELGNEIEESFIDDLILEVLWDYISEFIDETGEF